MQIVSQFPEPIISFIEPVIEVPIKSILKNISLGTRIIMLKGAMPTSRVKPNRGSLNFFICVLCMKISKVGREQLEIRLFYFI
jgi:hypothetical protein